MIFNFSWGRAKLFGVEIFGKHEDKWWMKHFFYPLWSGGRYVRDGIWWVRYRIDPRHKYHLIDTHLAPGYYDIDHLILNGMFSLLRRYVEEEHEGVESLEKWGSELLARDPDNFMADSDERQGRKELEAAALYLWWMEARPAMLKRRGELLDSLYGGDPRFVTELDSEIGGVKIYRNVAIRDDTETEELQRKELHDLEWRINEEETEMLKRLVDIRGGLWT